MKLIVTFLTAAFAVSATHFVSAAEKAEKTGKATEVDKGSAASTDKEKDKTGSNNTGVSGTGAGASPKTPGNSTAGSVEVGGNKATGPSKAQTGTGVPGTPSNP